MWDDRYSEDEYVYGIEPNDYLKETFPSLNLPSSAKILFLAEGEGRNAVWTAAHDSAYHVKGIDLSSVGLLKAQKLAKERNVRIETEVADMAQYDFGQDEWDLIVGIYCHLPPPIRTRVLEAIPKALRDGGYFLLECYTPDQLQYKTGGPPVSALMYSKEILQKAFEGTPVQTERNEELVREVVEGKYHNGQAAVVQFLGRKNTEVEDL